MLAHELVEDLLPRHPLLRKPDDVLVQGRADGAREVRGPAGVHVEIAAARTVELFLNRLDGGVDVSGGVWVAGRPPPQRKRPAIRTCPCAHRKPCSERCE